MVERTRSARNWWGVVMATVTREQAVDLLTKQVEGQFGVDELLEVHNELFPDEPFTEEEAHEDCIPLVEQIVAHLSRGLEPEEIVDVWSLIFPRHRHVWYDEEEERFHYNESKPTPAE
jgi:hypothetical protein